jgi:hypothetical protein
VFVFVCEKRSKKRYMCICARFLLLVIRMLPIISFVLQGSKPPEPAYFDN